MEYKYNIRDLKFILKEWLPAEEVFACDRFKENFSVEDVDPILTEAYKIAKEMINPINAEGDKRPCYFEDGVVHNAPGYKEAFQYIQQNGWGSSSECVEIEGGMPLILYKSVYELVSSACPALASNIKLVSGAANLIIKFGTEEDQKRFLPKMLDGSWQGTMNLTEPSAGSDVGDALSKSFPTDDPRIYKIKGTKMFITGGDGDMTENTIHMVLARPPQGGKGSAGLGLYVVPKYWVNEDGSLGKANDVTTISIEHKMGLNGSVTALLNFGENDECYGIMLGDPPDEKGRSKGLAMMFNMMNESRIGTGHNANNQSSAAYAFASQYATERIQGYLKGERVPIIKHGDVRRMLLDMKTLTEGIRAMVFKGFWNLDVAENSSDKEKAKECADVAAILTPLAKFYSSEMAALITAEAIQVLGGVGYTKEYPVEQYLRDSKILTIWEGTSFIHGNDLIGRKMTMGKGEPFKKWMQGIKDFIDQNQNAEGFQKELERLKQAYAAAEKILNQVYDWQADKETYEEYLSVYTTRIIMLFAQLYVGYCLLDQALLAQAKMAALGADHFDSDFYQGKIQSARYYSNNILPQTSITAEIIINRDSSVIDVPENSLIIN